MTTKGNQDVSDNSSGIQNQNEPAPVEQHDNPVESRDGGDKVALESYQKLLSEKKRIQAELDKLNASVQSREKEKLVEKEKFKELWDDSQKQVQELQQKVSSYEERWQDAIKLNAFHEAMGDRRIDPKYSGFIDTRSILLDSDTGEVNTASLKKEIERVCKEYPEIVRVPQKSQIPNNAPNSFKPLSYDAWSKLPLNEKKARAKEVSD